MSFSMLGVKPKPPAKANAAASGGDKGATGHAFKPSDRLKPKTVDLVRFKYLLLLF